MNTTIGTTITTQAFETTFNISDYLNFDFVFEAPHESVDAPSGTAVVHSLQSTAAHDPYVGFMDAADTEFANTFQALGGCKVLGNANANQAAPDDLSMGHAIQTAIENDASHDDFNVLESTVFAQTVGSGARETTSFPSKLISPLEDVIADTLEPNPSQIMEDPSVWLPVSPQIQQHLNTVYASDIIQQLSVPNPAPVLFFPAVEPFSPPTSSMQSPPNGVQTRHKSASTPLLESETTSINPSLLMHESPTLPQELFFNGMRSPFTRTNDNGVLDVGDSGSALLKKRTLDTDEADPKPASKRTRTAQVENFPVAAMDDDTDEDDEPVVTRRRTARHYSLPIAEKYDDSVGESRAESESVSESNSDDRSCDSGSPGSLSAASSLPVSPTPLARAGIPAHPRTKQAPTHGPNWRYEKAQEVRLREQRRKEWKQKRTNPLGVRGKAPSRKMQKLLEEIEDSEGFAEAHGYRVEEGVGSEENRGSVCRRPVRKGARKSYVGQE